LKQAQVGQTASIFIKDSMFDLPKHGPLIMIGPGTGVVPFIGFLETFQLAAHNGPTDLYFGCRRDDSDYIFKDFLDSSVTHNNLDTLRTAFSRPVDGESQYVQDLLKEDKDHLMLAFGREDSTICICGNTKMGQDVMALLKEWLGGDKVREMESQKRIVKELWSS
jgi:sulfite reductase alpha subunit-like flavoprotein